jgi:quercetin dioxygenase-like cupin family protein
MKLQGSMLGTLLIVSGCASSGSVPPAATAPTPTAVQWDSAATSELAALVQRLNDAWGKGDLETVRTLLAEDGFLRSFDLDMAGKPISFSSKAEVLAFAEQVFAEMKKAGATIQFTTKRLDCRATATYGVCSGELEASAQMGGKTETMAFRLTAAGQKNEGGWAATHWHGSMATAPEAPAPVVAPPPPPTVAFNAKELAWGTPPGAPPGLKVAVVSGDPAKGAFSAMVEFPKGTSFPRHYHDATTYAYLVKGSLKITMADGRVLDLKPGAAGVVAAKAVHTTESKGGAVVYQYSDGPDTTVMVDEQGNPLPPPAAAPEAPPAAPPAK